MQTTCRMCGKPIQIKASEVKATGNFCGYPCRSWHRVLAHSSNHPVADQICRAAIEVGRQIDLPPGVGSLRELHKRFGISESHLSWYNSGRHLDHPSQVNLDRLRKLAQDVLGEPLRWQGTTNEQRTLVLAQAGAERFRAQTPEYRAKLRKKAAKTLRRRPRRPLQTTPAYEAYWARLRTRDQEKLRLQGRLLTVAVRAALASVHRARGRPLTPAEFDAFVRDFSKRHNRPAAWVRAASNRMPGHRHKAIDYYGMIRSHTWRGRIDWPAVFRIIEVLERRRLDSVEQENLKRSYRREQGRLEAP